MAGFTIDGYDFAISPSGQLRIVGPGVNAVIGYPPFNAGSITSLATTPLAEQTPGALDKINALAANVNQINSDYRAANTPETQPAPPATASQAASNDAPKGPNAPAAAQVNANGRVVAPPDTTAPTNADTTSTTENNPDAGLDDKTRTTEQTQATDQYAQGINVRAEDGTLSNLRKNPETGQLYDPGGLPGGVDLTTSMGVAAAPDDGVSPNTTTAQADVNAGGNASLVKVIPQPNILDEFYSYTYVASVYLTNDAQYKRLLAGNSVKLDGYQLLFQSGGAPPNNGGPRAQPATGTPVFENDGQSSTVPAPETNYPDGGRSPYFADDFYIDSISLENILPCGGTGAAHQDTTLKFTLVEPQGMTLLDRLRDAVANHNPTNPLGKVNYLAATYLMVIRFYGYDQDGNLVMPIKGSMFQGSDTKAVVEKFIPFQIANIDWTVGTKTVSYDWKCKPVGQNIAGTEARGTIPYDLQLNAVTVEKLLSGTAKYSTQSATTTAPGTTTTSNQQTTVDEFGQIVATPAPPTAATAPSPAKTIVQGLMQAMNDFQQKLVYEGTYEQADHYSIEFVGPGANKIAGAVLQQKDAYIDKTKTPGGAPPTSSGGVNGLNPDTNSVVNNSRSFSVTAGQQILQVIELVVRNSSYIGSQALFTIDENGNQIPTKDKNYNKPVVWYNISMSATPRSNILDNKRNDYAYDIKYTVSPFVIKNLNSVYFPVNQFSGVHKSYPYWFTGQNTAVLEYQETLNALFKTTLSGSVPEDSTATNIRNSLTSSLNEIMMYTYAARSTESSAGALGKSFELGANAAEVLYDTTGLKNCKVKILGDPAWIMQGSLFRPVNQETFGGKALTSGFMPDGSIAFDNQEILFEIVWQRPEDYNLDTGLADPYSVTQKKYNNRLALQSRVYRGIKVTSDFRQGKFEQTLEGKLYNFVKPDGSNSANPSVAASTGSFSSSNALEEEQASNAAAVAVSNANRTASTNRTGTNKKTQTQVSALTDPRNNSNKPVGANSQGPLKAPSTSDTSGGYDALGNFTGNYVNTSDIGNASYPQPATDGAGNQIDTGIGNSWDGPPKLTGIISRSNAAAAAAAPRGRGGYSGTRTPPQLIAKEP